MLDEGVMERKAGRRGRAGQHSAPVVCLEPDPRPERMDDASGPKAQGALTSQAPGESRRPHHSVPADRAHLRPTQWLLGLARCRPCYL